MSQMTPGNDPTTQQQQQQGQETFLSPEERKQLHRLMGHPTDYPKEMMSHIKEWLSVNPPDFVASTFKGGKGQARYLARAVASAMTAVSGDSSEHTIYTYNLKAKTLSPTGQLKIKFFATYQSPDVSNTLTMRLKLGSTTVLTWTLDTDSLDGNARLGSNDITIVNGGSYSSQLAYMLGTQNRESGAYAAIQTNGTASEDTSADKAISITGQWAGGSADDIVSPKYLSIEVFNPVGA